MALRHESPYWGNAKSGLIHTLVTTAANEHDLNPLNNLLYGDEEFISGDAGYQGVEKRQERKDRQVDVLGVYT